MRLRVNIITCVHYMHPARNRV